MHKIGFMYRALATLHKGFNAVWRVAGWQFLEMHYHRGH